MDKLLRLVNLLKVTEPVNGPGGGVKRSLPGLRTQLPQPPPRLPSPLPSP